MDSMLDKATVGEFKIFYGIDRALYTILVKELCRNPLESLQIMGFWLWVERLGICKVISRLKDITWHLTNELAEEALVILKFMNDGTQPLSKARAEIPLTRCLLRRRITLQFFYKHREIILKEVRCLVTEVYIPALSDIVEVARRGFAEFSTKAMVTSPRPAPPALASASALSSRQILTPALAPVPSDPYEDSLSANFSALAIQGESTTPRRRARADICEYARTMFATFSKGYPVSKNEVRGFFTAMLGECIDSLHMQEVHSDQQPLYARIVFADPSFIQVILNGGAKAKFTINGKHVWMRRFVPRNGRPMSGSASD